MTERQIVLFLLGIFIPITITIIKICRSVKKPSDFGDMFEDFNIDELRHLDPSKYKLLASHDISDKTAYALIGSKNLNISCTTVRSLPNGNSLVSFEVKI